MDHITASNRLSAYLDGQLPPDLHAQIEAHLLECDACLTQLQELQQTSASLQKLTLPMPSLAFLERLHTSIETAARKPIIAMERFIGLLSGIAACLALIGGLLLMQPRAAASTAAASWEHDAVQLSEDQTDNAPETAMGQWMVASLNNHDQGGQTK